MPDQEKQEKQGSQGEFASNKPNRGQDEKPRTFVNQATGETRQATQREFKDTLCDQGFIDPEDGFTVEDDPTTA